MARMKFSVVLLCVLAAVVVLYLAKQVRQQSDTTPPAASVRDVETTVRNIATPLPDETVRLPDHGVIDSLNYSYTAELYHSYVNNIQYFCPIMNRMGKANDGGWEICISSVYRPKPPCLIYSFGINNDFSFDDDARTKLGCEIHCFDPSMKQPDHVRREGIFFHNLGIAAYNGSSVEGWKMLTLQALRSQLGHTKTPISILKMDIEGMEWEVIPEMVHSAALADVDQFVMEVHVMPVGLMNRVDPEHARYTRGLHVLKLLHSSGFRTFFSHRNPGCTYMSRFGPERIGCHELFTVRLK